MNRSYRDDLSLRLGFTALIGALAYLLRPFGLTPVPSAAGGILCAGIFLAVERRVRTARLTSLLGALFGAASGGLLALIFVAVLNPVLGPLFGASDSSGARTALFFRLLIPLFAGFLGLAVGLAKSDLINPGAIGLFSKKVADTELLKLLDSSVLIDGRIAEIAEAGFLEGHLIIPQFVLHELQLVADSPDSARRNRGRRGLDVVSRMQKMSGISVELSTLDFPAIREVDLKLIEAAKLRQAGIVTNDFNLNKLAEVQGIKVLNINELAQALRPVVLPGETLHVFILREGKEHNQGVGYLEDGTMVVVDNAKRQISKTVDVVVTSVLQTTAGKMIFARMEERTQSPGEGKGTSGESRGASAS